MAVLESWQLSNHKIVGLTIVMGDLMFLNEGERLLAARAMALLVAVLALAAFAVGCGGDEDSASGESIQPVTTSSLSKSEFIKQAEKACEEERENLLDEGVAYIKRKEAAGVPTPVVVAKMAKAVMIPTIEAEMQGMRDLGVPEGDEEEVEEFLASQQAGIENVKKLAKAQSIEQVETRFREAADLMREYGFVSACLNSL